MTCRRAGARAPAPPRRSRPASPEGCSAAASSQGPTSSGGAGAGAGAGERGVGGESGQHGQPGSAKTGAPEWVEGRRSRRRRLRRRRWQSNCCEADRTYPLSIHLMHFFMFWSSRAALLYSGRVCQEQATWRWWHRRHPPHSGAQQASQPGGLFRRRVLPGLHLAVRRRSGGVLCFCNFGLSTSTPQERPPPPVATCPFLANMCEGQARSPRVVIVFSRGWTLTKAATALGSHRWW